MGRFGLLWPASCWTVSKANMREGHTEVLVVGAGPIGLWTALQLADADVEVTIVDRESRTAARSYACALHGNSLKMLQQFGLVTPLLEKGRRIDKVALFSGEQRRAQIDLSKSGGEFPFLLIVPQNVL